MIEDRAAGIHTGVAVFSSTVGSRIKLTLHRESGEEVSIPSKGGFEIDLPAHGSRVLFIREMFDGLFPAADRFQGTMTVEGGIDRPQEGGSLAGAGIYQLAGSGELSAFPVASVEPPPSAQTLYFPAFLSGGEGVTTIVLVNPSPSRRAKGTLSFFDEAGRSLSIAVNELAAANSVPYDIGPLGGAFFIVPRGPAASAGTARADTSEGAVAGLVRHASSARGTLTAPLSLALEEMITPVQRNLAAGLNTELALSSAESALALDLTLRDANGAAVQGGSARLQLPARGGVRRTLDELFPNAGTESFEGTISITATGGAFAAQAVRSAAGSGGRAVMPVARIEP